MKQSFSIHFNYPFREKDFSISLTGNVMAQNGQPWYVISHIRFTRHPNGPLDALPEVKVQQRVIRGEKVWVHADTQKESELSRIIGEAIDFHLNNNPSSGS